MQHCTVFAHISLWPRTSTPCGISYTETYSISLEQPTPLVRPMSSTYKKDYRLMFLFLINCFWSMGFQDQAICLHLSQGKQMWNHREEWDLWRHVRILVHIAVWLTEVKKLEFLWNWKEQFSLKQHVPLHFCKKNIFLQFNDFQLNNHGRNCSCHKFT